MENLRREVSTEALYETLQREQEPWEYRFCREEDYGMYLEEKEGRKRKWQEGGKMMRKEGSEERDVRKMPPKKVFAAVGEMGGSGGSSSSSHMSPGWPVNDLELDLAGELSMNEALLSLPALPVFKQEVPSPPGGGARRTWNKRDERQITNMAVDVCREGMEDGNMQQSPNHNMMTQHDSPDSMQCAPALPPSALMVTGYMSTSNNVDNKNAGLLMCSPTSSLEGFLHSPPHQRPEPSFKDDTRFQYVLAAATSIATKTTEETLTYLNQGQPYEMKLKKLGDLSIYKGKILKSIIKICFHERRLQYMEREQIAQWHADRPGERIVEVDVPLSYGLIKVQHPSNLNCLHVYWDPFKDVGVYIKVNCISTEFTAKKHGGEKGVPFRIQVETYLASDDSIRLHAAAAQIKVFKLKGADRKHKQDREKVMRRPRQELEKYQPGCEATVLTTLSNDALMPQPSLVTSSPPYSPDGCVSPRALGSPGLCTKSGLPQTGLVGSSSQIKQIYSQDCSEVKVSSPECVSPGAILPDLPQQPTDDQDRNGGLSKDATSSETQSWLLRNRFQQHAATFGNFSGADLLRLSRDDLIQICGLADGIRLFNALHAKRIEPRLTMYVSWSGCNMFSALYLHACKATELTDKLRQIVQDATAKDCTTVVVTGPGETRVRLSDDVVRHLPDHGTYLLHYLHHEHVLLLTSTTN